MTQLATSFHFDLIYQSKKSRARVGKITTPHGTIETPNFVPVGTNAVLKSVDPVLVQKDIALLFCNTYHLLLQPGVDVIDRGGKLHSFMGRNAPIITDSGGFQVFSLAYGGVTEEIKSRGTKRRTNAILRIDEEGVLFRSYRDGKKILLSPESSILAQKQLGADIIVAFDELPPYHVDEKALKTSFERTHRWEKRSLEIHQRQPQDQALYAVIHGGVDRNLRRESCALLSALPFDGFAIGGSVGKDRQEMIHLLGDVVHWLPIDKPNHLLGIGDLYSLHHCIPLGIDTFDSAYPTKCARHATLLTQQGNKKITQKQYADAFSPIEEGCSCHTCQFHTQAYLHHLFKAKELLGLTLATIHNLHFMNKLMQSYREQILHGDL